MKDYIYNLKKTPIVTYDTFTTKYKYTFKYPKNKKHTFNIILDILNNDFGLPARIIQKDDYAICEVYIKKIAYNGLDNEIYNLINKILNT